MNGPLGWVVLLVFGCGVAFGFYLSNKRLWREISDLRARVEELEAFWREVRLRGETDDLRGRVERLETFWREEMF